MIAKRQCRLKLLVQNLLLPAIILGASTMAYSEESKDSSTAEPASDKKGIFLCNGVWVNKGPCKDDDKKSNAVLPYIERKLSPEKKARAERISQVDALLHPLRMKASEIKREHQADYSLRSIEEECLDEDTAIKECREMVSVEQEKLLKYEVQLKTLALEKEKAVKEIQGGPEGTDNPTVIINQIQPIVPIFRPRYPRPPFGGHGPYPHGYPHNNTKPPRENPRPMINTNPPRTAPPQIPPPLTPPSRPQQLQPRSDSIGGGYR